MKEVQAGAAGVHVCVRTDVPPVHPDGNEETTARVCSPTAGQTLGVQSLYVNDVQVGAPGVQVCVRTGFPPVQPFGDADATVRVCWPFAGQTLGVQSV